MRARLISWWHTRTARERRLLLVMMVLFAVLVAWLGIARPVGDALSRARARHAGAVAAFADARVKADAIGALERNRPKALQAPIASFLAQQARDAGFGNSHVEAAGVGRVNMVIDAVRPPVFFALVATMERRYGLIVDSLTARTNSDATLAVQASLRIRGR